MSSWRDYALPAVDAGECLRHTIEFSDESTPTRKASPAGVLGAEMIRAAHVSKRFLRSDGPPPVDPGELIFLAVDTRTPYVTEFDGPDGGKAAHYMLRWINSKAETGPQALDGPQRTEFAAAKRPPAACQGWSQTVSATIGA